MTLSDPNPGFKVTGYFKVEYHAEKKLEKKLTNRYDTQSAQSNAGKQSWSIGLVVLIQQQL